MSKNDSASLNKQKSFKGIGTFRFIGAKETSMNVLKAGISVQHVTKIYSQEVNLRFGSFEKITVGYFHFES